MLVVGVSLPCLGEVCFVGETAPSGSEPVYAAAAVLMYLYLAALVFGGVLLGSSILLGGHDDADLDLDGDADLDADADGFDKDIELDKDVDFGDGVDVFWILRSLRFWMFFLAFFGLTGVVLDGLGLVSNSLITLALALGVGALSGAGAASVIRALQRDQTAEAGGSSDFVGKSAKVLIPVERGGVGKVRVEVKGQMVDVLAFADEEDEIAAEDEVLIVEMEGTRARIARVDD